MIGGPFSDRSYRWLALARSGSLVLGPRWPVTPSLCADALADPVENEESAPDGVALGQTEDWIISNDGSTAFYGVDFPVDSVTGYGC